MRWEDYTFYKGVDYQISIPCEADFRDCTARCQLRERPDNDEVLDELTTTDNRIVLYEGGVKLLFPGDVTKNYNFRRAYFDLLITDEGGRTVRAAEGRILILQGVTR